MSTQTVTNMASLLCREQFKCCICLDIYTDPVSIPCAHNFCLDCIESYWDTKDKPECPLCKKKFRRRPELRINREFAEMITFIKRTAQEDDVDTASPTEAVDIYEDQDFEADVIPCDVCPDNKSTSVKSCLVCQTSYCETHLAPHLKVPVLQRHRLTDPATFTSSHLCRKHNEPLTMFCKKEQMPVCVRCTGENHKNHDTILLEKASKRTKNNLRATKANIQQMIQNRLRKMEEITNSVDLSKKIVEREIESSSQVSAMLISAIQRHQAALVEQLKTRQDEAERRAERLLDELQQEIIQLHSRGGELHQLELTQNPLHIIQGFPSLGTLPSTKEWSEVTVHYNNCMGTVRRSVDKLVDVCQEVANKLSAEEVDKMSQYAVDVTLDPETASGWLVLSPDGKKVSLSNQRATLPDSPQRFDTCVCVLGKQSFRYGRCYWEVQVGDKTDWDLGLARKSVNRKGAVMVRPDSGYWAICRRKGGSVSACVSPAVTIHLQETPQKVGIFLDYEEGSVSFYDAETKTHIYTYSGCNFTEPLCPYFNPCVQDNGKSTPLVICPRSVQPEITLESDV